MDLGQAGGRAAAIQRRSLQIFVSPTAYVRRTPLSSTSASRPPWASKWSRASVNASPVPGRARAITCAGSPAGVLMPVPTAVPPSGSSRTRGSAASMRSRA